MSTSVGRNLSFLGDTGDKPMLIPLGRRAVAFVGSALKGLGISIAERQVWQNE